jgi:citrate synthase
MKQVSERVFIKAKGLRDVVVADSAISYVDGINGTLNYRGYSINEIANRCVFEEIIYLIWYGDLPNRAQFESFVKELRDSREIDENILSFLKQAAQANANPMDVIRTGVSLLGTFDPNMPLNSFNEQINKQAALKIVANIPIIIAYYHRLRQGKELLPINKDLSEAEHFLYLLTGNRPGSKTLEALDLLYTLQAEHSYNNSTFTAIVVISSVTDMYSAITAAIGSLKGPLHGGANQGIIPMLEEIGSIENVDRWVHTKLKKKELIMGIGHPVYKVVDPRAILLKEKAIQMKGELKNDKWILMGERIEKIMVEEKNLYANIDFYSAQVYHSLDIPGDMFTPIFAIARSVGWVAHCFEQLAENRIFRPDCNYVGYEIGRKFVPMDKR